MKRSSHGLSFLGFVALADLIFAVSAGLLLLNPLRLDDFDEQADPASSDIAQLTANIQALEQEIVRGEQSINDIERALNVLRQDQNR